MSVLTRDAASAFDELGLESPFAERIDATERPDPAVMLGAFAESPFAEASEAGWTESVAGEALEPFERFDESAEGPWFESVEESEELESAHARCGAEEAPAGDEAEALESETWSGSADQLAFRDRVFAAHLSLSKKAKGAPLRDLRQDELQKIPTTDIWTRPETAEAAGRLLEAARAALAKARSDGDADALRTTRLTATSGYRGYDHQLGRWQALFKKYYRQSQLAREGLPDGAHSQQALTYMLTPRSKEKGKGGFGLAGRIAAPGYSNHQGGTAVDFLQERQGRALTNGTGDEERAKWRSTWFHRWLKANARTFGFTPISTEEWHWEFKPGAPASGKAQSGTGAARPASASPLAGGTLWTYPSRASGQTVAIFVPRAAQGRDSVDVLLYVHGLLNVCGGLAVRPAGLVSNAAFGLGKIIADSGRPMVLVVPLVQTGDDKSWAAHGLDRPQALNALLAEVLAAIGQRGNAAAPSISRLIIAGHSRAYGILYPLARAAKSPVLAEGALARLSNLWLLDATYGKVTAGHFNALVAARPGLAVTIVYLKGSPTDKFGGRAVAGRVALQPIAPSIRHCEVPGKILPSLLAGLEQSPGSGQGPAREFRDFSSEAEALAWLDVEAGFEVETEDEEPEAEFMSDEQFGPFEALEPEYLDDSEAPADPEWLDEAVTKLAQDWSRRKGGAPSAEARRAQLLADYRDTMEGARKRYKDKFAHGAFSATVSRAWLVSRQNQMLFETATPIAPLPNFAPPPGSADLVSDPLIGDSNKAPVAPITVAFVKALRARFKGVSATTYHNHGGGKFNNRGYSVDLWIKGRDEQGFYPRQKALELLRAVDAAARAVGTQWRIIYNDFAVADAINRELRRKHVIFVGTVRRDKRKRVAGLNWHGPEPLILHFHLDLAPIQGAAQKEAEGFEPETSWSEQIGEAEWMPSESSYSPEAEAFSEDMESFDSLLEGEAEWGDGRAPSGEEEWLEEQALEGGWSEDAAGEYLHAEGGLEAEAFAQRDEEWEWEDAAGAEAPLGFSDECGGGARSEDERSGPAGEDGRSDESAGALWETESWTGSDDQAAFRDRVLAEHIARTKSRRGAPLRDLRDDELKTIPGSDVKTLAATADAAGRLLAAANADLAKARDAGDADALRTLRLTAVSGYRSSDHQRQLWLGYFSGKNGYYDRTRVVREGFAEGLHSARALNYMLMREAEGGFGLTGRIAAPGYSNHQNGIAVDLWQKRTKGHDINNKSDKASRAKWRSTWFHRWLKANASTFGFVPLATEEWHWEHKPKGPPPASAAPTGPSAAKPKSAASPTAAQFVAAYGAAARASQAANGVPALVTLGQAALESGWGKHAPRFNFFGIKAKGSDPESSRQLLRTREVFSDRNRKFPEIISITPRADGKFDYVVKDWFRAYPDAATAFNAHGEFLVRNKGYAKAFTVGGDPYAFAAEVARAGYATDPAYARILTSVMRTIEAAGGR